MMVALISGERTLVACWSPHFAVTSSSPISQLFVIVPMM
jgi:hypothetical protein